MNRLLKIVLPIVVLIVGVASAALLAFARKTPERVERSAPGPLVEVVSVHRADVPVTVTGHGQVGARVSVEVVPQVSGKVVEVHRSLVAGGRFAAGEALVVIDPRDYELAADRARAAVARARVMLEQELAEAEVARTEWEDMNPGQAPPSGLVLREPQVAQARAEIDAAEADLSAAELNLERTRVSVPFDGIVVTESVDVGQYLGPGRAVATVYGTEAVEIRVPLASGELEWIDVPDRPGRRGSSVEVTAASADASHSWQGAVVRMEGTVDERSRMVHVVVEVGDPFARRDGRPPLLPGTFVDVSMRGRSLLDVVPVPRHAVHDGHVWIVEDGLLRIREVELARADRQQALVAAGLDDGAKVVVSPLDAVTDGMSVRVAGGDLGGEV
jgi:RND family efflux transporter MFP subunit